MNELIGLMIQQSAALLTHSRDYINGMPSISNDRNLSMAVYGHTGYLITVYFLSRGLHIDDVAHNKLLSLMKDEKFSGMSDIEVYNRTVTIFTNA